MVGGVNQRDLEGRRHGIWKHYWGDGTLWWRGHYFHGKEHGVWEWYYGLDGTLGRKGYFLTIK